jgi:AAA domain/RepB DNA-primase from phage plasmid/MarR family
MTGAQPDLNLDEARRFLNTLGPGETFSFQMFVDRKAASEEERQNFTKLSRVLHGTFDQHVRELSRVNCPEEDDHPRGIYVTVNRTNGQGRTAKDVTGVRAVFVDLDDAPIEPVMEGPLKPSIVVQSSAGKHHAYWLLARDGLPLDQFTPFQKMLAIRFSGDRRVCDLPRVLRIPGFFHRKAEPFLVRIVSLDADLIYTRSQLIEAFGDPDEATESASAIDVQLTVNNDHVAAAKAARIVAEAVERVARDRSRGRHAQALWIGWATRKAGLNEETAKLAAHLFFQFAPTVNSDGEYRPLTRDEIQSAVLNAYAEGKAVNGEKRLSEWIIVGPEIVTLKIAPRNPIIDPFLMERSLNMIYARRGVGKTWLAVELALSIAIGKNFFKWPTTAARRVLYVDGEMPLSDLQQRIMQLSGSAPPENLMLLPSEPLFLEDQPLLINKPDHQARLLTLLDDLDDRGHRPDALIFDNQSSLTSGMDENSNSDLDAFLAWLIQLRHRGYAVVVVHHAGKNGQQRGASRREDLLDTSIKLEELPGNIRESGGGAAFTISFEKVRGKRPSPDTLTVELVASAEGGQVWTVGTPQSQSADMRVLLAIYTGEPALQAELATRLEVKPARISQIVKRLRAKGWIKGKLDLTPQGYELAERLGARNLPF